MNEDEHAGDRYGQRKLYPIRCRKRTTAAGKARRGPRPTRPLLGGSRQSEHRPAVVGLDIAYAKQGASGTQHRPPDLAGYPRSSYTALMEHDATPPKSDPVIEAFKRDIDRTLIRERLKLDPEQRMVELIRLQAWANELARAGRKAG